MKEHEGEELELNLSLTSKPVYITPTSLQIKIKTLSKHPLLSIQVSFS